MNTVIQMLRKRGYEFTMGEEETFVTIKKIKVKFTLREKTRSVNNGTSSSEKTIELTGKLVLKAEVWRDSKSWSDDLLHLEEMLLEIIADIELMVETTLRERRQAIGPDYEPEDKAAIKLMAEKIQQHSANMINPNSDLEPHEIFTSASKEQRKEDLLAFKESLKNAERWQKANNLRAYINEVERRAKEQDDFSDELSNRLERLRKQADWYDPLINAEDELLDAVNKSTLSTPKE